MSGPNPPGPDSAGIGRTGAAGRHSAPEENTEEVAKADPHAGAGAPIPTGETEFYSQAYSAPESEQFTSGPYVPADAALYDYDSYEPADDSAVAAAPPRWPWVVGVTAIIAAIALVVSVSVLVTSNDTDDLALTRNQHHHVGAAGAGRDHHDDTAAAASTASTADRQSRRLRRRRRRSRSPSRRRLRRPPQAPPAPPPPPAPSEAPPPPPTTTTPAGPRQVTYSVTGTKAPGDIISITYIDAAGRSRTQRNVYIPWSFTVTPISQSEVGSVQASSLFLVSRLNCSITTSDGRCCPPTPATHPRRAADDILRRTSTRARRLRVAPTTWTASCSRRAR